MIVDKGVRGGDLGVSNGHSLQLLSVNFVASQWFVFSFVYFLVLNHDICYPFLIVVVEYRKVTWGVVLIWDDLLQQLAAVIIQDFLACGPIFLSISLWMWQFLR